MYYIIKFALLYATALVATNMHKQLNKCFFMSYGSAVWATFLLMTVYDAN